MFSLWATWNHTITSSYYTITITIKKKNLSVCCALDFQHSSPLLLLQLQPLLLSLVWHTDAVRRTWTGPQKHNRIESGHNQHVVSLLVFSCFDSTVSASETRWFTDNFLNLSLITFIFLMFLFHSNKAFPDAFCLLKLIAHRSPP